MTAAFLGAMFLATLVLFTITRLEVERIERHHYLQRVDFFNAHPTKPGDIVFLGDSLTAGANWNELFPGLPVCNRGINADLTTGALARMDCITVGKPAAIFILIGTNDLPWYAHRHDELILGTYAEILEKIKKDTPKTKVFVQSILPRARGYSQRIQKLNAELKTIAESMDYSFIDLFSSMANSKGELKSEFNNDHLHLLAGGYARWVEIITPYIKSI